MGQSPSLLGYLFLSPPSFNESSDSGVCQKFRSDDTDHCRDDPRPNDPISPRPRRFAWYKFAFVETRTTWDWKMDHCPDTQENCGKTAPQDVTRSPSTVGRYPAMYQVLVWRHFQCVQRFWGCLSKRRVRRRMEAICLMMIPRDTRLRQRYLGTTFVALKRKDLLPMLIIRRRLAYGRLS